MKIKRIKIDYRHIICVAITLAFLICTITIFPDAFVRFGESVRDLVGSVKYYFTTMFGAPTDSVPTASEIVEPNLTEPAPVIIEPPVPTVTEPSKVNYVPLFKVAEKWSGFVQSWTDYWCKWISRDNFLGYCVVVVKNLFIFAQIALLVLIPLILILYTLFNHIFNKRNNDYNQDSKPLILFKQFTAKTYLPVKKWCISFYDFLICNKSYRYIWLIIWLFNFNLFTIVIEFIAYYLYFSLSFDFVSLYPQVVKLVKDLTPALRFIPGWVWIIIGLLWLNELCKKVGYARLNHLERRNRGFINERPIVCMVCGTMGKKKTTVITDMALSSEIMFRDKAFELILKNDLKFPNFPWINLENEIKRAMTSHEVYNLATVRQYVKRLGLFWYYSQFDKAWFKSFRRHLKKLGVNAGSNLCFDYDFDRYGLTYDDNLEVVDLWQVLESYAQLYFIYVIQSSLLVSNYSLRTDLVLNSAGNFPGWDCDLFHRDSRVIDSISRHSHIIDFDALRLGRKVLEENPNKDSFDFGVVVVTEIGKERKNNLQLQEVKSKEFVANQKNDGFDDYLKMCRHNATVDKFPFIKFLTDEQRPESWGANARDLCEIVHIVETSDMQLARPFFFVVEMIYELVYGWFLKKYNRYRFNRGDNTLTMYAIKKMATVMQNYYLRTYNTFGFCNLLVQVENGTQDGPRADKRYFLMTKKIYSKRFSTDCFSDFFTIKTLRSNVGLDDMPEYETEKATFDELKKQNSYFVTDLTNRAGDK